MPLGLVGAARRVGDLVDAEVIAWGVRRAGLYIMTKFDGLPARLSESATRRPCRSVPHMSMHHLDLKQAWHEIEAVQAEGLTKAIGVSNFQPMHLDVILHGARVIPAVSQVCTLVAYGPTSSHRVSS
ncbi:hypothetical protein PHLGIDRAFT_113706 [Phlebiopsis gigantea 11061_1 CR5-6]|uniref:NADP-dependent oxidoreductase domain-containing protein n=1 Tax=Phlebiopsis gigantea (strain 11061_1 CR5-6) TaxID=745531 RepID=A0A0C3SDW9_PHLG1|nr:hypothetical protein PHLGIDRAFT_113706 [Phlebiopsis gigantea 11061_1 CR5-6]